MEFIDGPPPPAPHWVAAAVAELKQRPGEWAIVHRYYNTNSVQYAKRRLRLMGCETRQRKIGPEYELWACWPVNE